MKLLFDFNLSPRLVTRPADLFLVLFQRRSLGIRADCLAVERPGSFSLRSPDHPQGAAHFIPNNVS